MYNVYISLSVQLGQFTDKGYEESMAYSYCSTHMQYAFGVLVHGDWEVLYLKFYSVFSEPFINDKILLCKGL